MRYRVGKICLYSFFAALLFSCASKEAKVTRLYAIDSLLNAQSNYLSEHHATLKKITQLDDGQDEVILKPINAGDWKKELEIFAALDNINKPINRDRYQHEDHTDSKSNLKVHTITTQSNLSVRYLKVYYQEDSDRIRRIEAEYNESNALYSSARVLTLEFQYVGNSAALTSYGVIGGQKMILSDSVQYAIKGSVTFTN